MGVEEKVTSAVNGLTDEQKERILQEVEKERRRLIFFKLFYEAINDPDDNIKFAAIYSLSRLIEEVPEKSEEAIDILLDVQLPEHAESKTEWAKKIASMFPTLAKKTPLVASRIFTKVLDSDCDTLRLALARSLGEIYKYLPEMAVTLCERILNGEDAEGNRLAAGSLGALAELKPGAALTLFTKALDNNEYFATEGLLGSVSGIARISPEVVLGRYAEFLIRRERAFHDAISYGRSSLAVEHFDHDEDETLEFVVKNSPPTKVLSWSENSIKKGFSEQRVAAAKCLKYLLAVDSVKAEELYKKAICDYHVDVRRAAAQGLGALAQSGVREAYELFRKAMRDRDFYVRKAAAQGLGALAQSNPLGAYKLFKRAMRDCEDQVWYAAVEGLQSLMKKDQRLATRLYRKATRYKIRAKYKMRGGGRVMREFCSLSTTPESEATNTFFKSLMHPIEDIRIAAAKEFPDLARQRPDVAKEVYSLLIKRGGLAARASVAYNLERLVEVDAELAGQYYDAVTRDDWTVFGAAAKALGALARATPSKAVERFQKAITCVHRPVRESAVEQLPVLLELFPEQALEMYQKLSSDQSIFVRRRLASQLSAISRKSSQAAEIFYSKLIYDDEKFVREEAAEHVFGVAARMTKSTDDLFESTFRGQSRDVILSAARQNDSLSMLGPDRLQELYQQELAHLRKVGDEFDNPEQFEGITLFLTGLAASINCTKTKPFTGVDLVFIKEHLLSSICEKDERNVVEGLKKVVNEAETDYNALLEVMKIGKTRNLAETVECANLHPQGYTVCCRFAQGGWSNLYLIIDEGETDDDFLKVLKVPAKNIRGNDNVERIIAKFGSLERALEEIGKEEKRINSKTSPTSRDRFPNFHYRPIPQFFDVRYVGKGDKKVPALIYEYVRGSDFDGYFAVQRSDAETIKTFARAAYAVNYVHTKGFTHNDLKGDNMLVAENGNVYLLDLAFSRLEDSQSTIKGVRSLTAPERILGGVPPTPRADQYSFGCMLYKAIVGKLPLSYEDVGGNKDEFARKVFLGELKPVFDELRRRTSPELAQIIERCLEYHPEDRFSSMQHVENALVSLEEIVS